MLDYLQAARKHTEAGGDQAAALTHAINDFEFYDPEAEGTLNFSFDRTDARSLESTAASLEMWGSALRALGEVTGAHGPLSNN